MHGLRAWAAVDEAELLFASGEAPQGPLADLGGLAGTGASGRGGDGGLASVVAPAPEEVAWAANAGAEGV